MDCRLMLSSRAFRACVALWLFAFLAGVAWAVGPSDERVAERTAPPAMVR